MYAKVFRSMYSGSMYGAGPTIFATWTWILTHCDSEGYVEVNPKMLAPMIGCDEEHIIMALDYLVSPDDQSRTPDQEGRRIEKIGTFLYSVVNHQKYRKIATMEDRRVQNREAKRRERAKNEDCHHDVSICHHSSAMSAHTDTDTEANTDKKLPHSREEDFDHFWGKYPRKVGKRDAVKAWKQTSKERPALKVLLTRLEALARSDQWTRDGGQYVPYPAAWLRRGGWDDELPAPEAERNGVDWDAFNARWAHDDGE